MVVLYLSSIHISTGLFDETVEVYSRGEHNVKKGIVVLQFLLHFKNHLTGHIYLHFLENELHGMLENVSIKI